MSRRRKVADSPVHKTEYKLQVSINNIMYRSLHQV